MTRGRPKLPENMKPKRRCAQPDCREFHPCKTHPWGWQSSKTPQLTSEERKLMEIIKKESGYKCYKCGKIDSYGQTDHIINRARGGKTTRDNLQFLCKPCHTKKTHKESRVGKNKKDPDL